MSATKIVNYLKLNSTFKAYNGLSLGEGSLKHYWHLVNTSSVIIFSAISVFGIVFGLAMYWNDYYMGLEIMLANVFWFVINVSIWARDMFREALVEGKHTIKVMKGLRVGVLLFIFSEVMFFSAFFWSFFHNRLSPDIALGGIWPPEGIQVMQWNAVPLLNTFILLTSGVAVTWAHSAITSNRKITAVISQFLTIALAVAFLGAQFVEYVYAPFTIADGYYGTTFYLLTGFHGLHVLLGSILIIITWIRIVRSAYLVNHHVGFEASAWYWHFVDVVWLFLFLCIYIDIGTIVSLLPF